VHDHDLALPPVLDQFRPNPESGGVVAKQEGGHGSRIVGSAHPRSYPPSFKSVFRTVEFERPGLLLVVGADAEPPQSPGAIADLTLIPIAPKPGAVARLTEGLSAFGWLAPAVSRRGGLWFASERPPASRDLAAATRIFQRRGGTALGWAVDDPVHDRPKAA
jgi:hypothetical protein